MIVYGSSHPQHTCGPVAAVDKTADQDALARAETVFLLIQGMGCPVCAMRVHNSLLRLGGVLAVEVSLTSGMARVRYDPAKIGPEVFPDAVTDAGNDSCHRYTAQLLV